MDNREILHHILNNIKGIDANADNFNKYSKIPQIEIDLLLSKIRNLYDEVLLLERINRLYTIEEEKDEENITFSINDDDGSFELDVDDSEIKDEDTEGKETVIPEISIPEEVKENTLTTPLPKEENKKLPEKEEEIKAPIIETPLPPDESKDKTIGATNIEEKEIKKPETNTDSIPAKELAEESKSINDLISANQSGNVLANKLNKKPIANINSAIGLNDKFQFIRELFGGLSDEYSKTVEVLNNLSSFGEACEYIEKRFDWDKDDPVVIKFLEIVNKRFL